MSEAVIFIKEDLKISEVKEEFLVGILSVVSLLGSLGGGRTSNMIGRKWTMAIATVVFQSGALTMTLAPSFSILMIGRLLAGVGIGFGVAIAPIYIAEISLNISRDTLTSFLEIFINIRILLGYVSNYAFSGFSTHINWRIMLAVGIIPSVFISFAIFVILESLRWLVMQNKIEEARQVLLKTIENEKEVDERLAEIQQATGVPSKEDKLITEIDTTVYYSPEIFKAVGIKDNSKLLATTVAVGISKTIFILVTKLGRKPLLYISTTGMTICLFSIGATLSMYYSLYGHVEKLAEEIKKGADSVDGVEATLWYRRVCWKRLTVITQLVQHGMLFVPIGYIFGGGMFEMNEVKGGSLYGAGTYAGGDGSRQPTKLELEQAFHQGKYIVTITKKLKK
ncbi:putative polyol transporter [Arachis hypogaea]|nr:putative polyol transporter [Arachis hypogaea]